MNGVHDMGGMHGLGTIEREENEPVFHQPWEARVYALNRAMSAWRKWNIDAGRHQIEQIPGAEYLHMSYYEKWFARLIELSLKHGLVSREEVDTGRPSPGSAKAEPALPANKVAETLRRGGQSRRDVLIEPHFRAGDRVRAKNINPIGHTRLVRYARGKTGVIDRDHGVFVFPDSNAHFLGENPQHVYSVRFSAQELWGCAASRHDAVYIDLWDDYLERA